MPSEKRVKAKPNELNPIEVRKGEGGHECNPTVLVVEGGEIIGWQGDAEIEFEDSPFVGESRSFRPGSTSRVKGKPPLQKGQVFQGTVQKQPVRGKIVVD